MMTYEKRHEILSKDALSIEDMMELLGLNYHMAAKTIREIKFKSDRLGIQGKVHTQDYLDYYRLSGKRYERECEE